MHMHRKMPNVIAKGIVAGLLWTQAPIAAPGPEDGEGQAEGMSAVAADVDGRPTLDVPLIGKGSSGPPAAHFY
jgi:hypothetical protein